MDHNNTVAQEGIPYEEDGAHPLKKHGMYIIILEECSLLVQNN